MANQLVLKMKLQAAVAAIGDASIAYTLDAVTGDENKPWSTFTPSGRLAFSVTNPDAPKLEAGEYLVTLQRVEATADGT